MIIKARTVLTIETGEYDERAVSGPLTVLKDIDIAKVKKQFTDDATYCTSHKTVPAKDWFYISGWLRENGYIKMVPHTEWCIFDFGRDEFKEITS